MDLHEMMNCALSPLIRTLNVRGVRLDSSLDDSFWKSFVCVPFELPVLLVLTL